MNVGHVEGGTHAGWKRQKPAPKPWMCKCATKAKPYFNPGYLKRCPDCKTERP